MDKLPKEIVRLGTLSNVDNLEGNMKIHKTLYAVNEKLKEEQIKTRMVFVRNFHGPTDEGLSKDMLKYEKMDLVELEELYLYSQKSTRYKITQKGKRWVNGISIFFEKLKDKGLISKNPINIINVESESLKDLSGSQIADSECVQEFKQKNALGVKR
ncbi:hypothetical protein J2127_000995 [Methanococcus voltae]|uniref:hypothetical protein n=1 Tax=Methanococcus voltae TaxID=2188 RepID=UPI001AE50E76|nr:hypothetical protein [Methanococcus voltae]MBP2143827.1 hypothetical protein [Methanococcus voltae]